MVIISIVGVAWVLWGLKTAITESGPVSVIYGPYYCKDKSLIMKQTFNVNRLAGTSSMTDITITYDNNVVFTSIYSFKDTIEKRTGKTFRFDEYEKYLDNTQKSVTLFPSQEELISRGVRTHENGRVVLGSMSTASSEDLQNFAECFNKNKKLIYDDEINKIPPYQSYLYFDKAYLLESVLK